MCRITVTFTLFFWKADGSLLLAFHFFSLVTPVSVCRYHPYQPWGWKAQNTVQSLEVSSKYAPGQMRRTLTPRRRLRIVCGGPRADLWHAPTTGVIQWLNLLRQLRHLKSTQVCKKLGFFNALSVILLFISLTYGNCAHLSWLLLAFRDALHCADLCFLMQLLLELC